MRAPIAIRLVRLAAAGALAVAAAAPSRVWAQRADSARAGAAAPPRRAPVAVRSDSAARPPIRPARAFLYSALIPGAGQARLQRYNAGALFVGIELASVAMLVKSRVDLRDARRLYQDSIIVGYTTSTAGALQPTYQQCETGREVVRPCTMTQERVRARRVHYEDWVAAILFNHLFAGADAFVAAQLWDLPTEVSASPDRRGVTVAARIAW